MSIVVVSNKQEDNLLIQIDLHTLEHSNNRLLNVRNLNSKATASFHQFCRIQFVIGTTCSENLGLFFQGEVGVGEFGINVLLVQVQDLIVRDRTRIGEVINTLVINTPNSIIIHDNHEESFRYWREEGREGRTWSWGYSPPFRISKSW